MKDVLKRLVASSYIRLSLVPLLVMSSAVQATNYREDSFEYFGAPSSLSGTYLFAPVFQDFHIKEKKKIVLIHGDVTTPIEYSDGASISLTDAANYTMLVDAGYDSFEEWDGITFIDGAENKTGDINVFIGDFNGDGHSDQLLQANYTDGATHFSTDGSLILIYGSDNEYPSGIDTITDPLSAYSISMLSAGNVTITVADFNGDGISDINFEYINGEYSTKYVDAVAYGSASGMGEVDWEHRNGPEYTSSNNSPSAVKPNNGSIVTGGSSGSFRVTESGAASFTLPIYSPKGPAGMTTGISLGYSSQGGNGPLGKGWAINTGAAISLCPATEFQNVSTYLAQFCLNGSKLIELSGEGSTIRTYATETTDISKITGYFGSDTAAMPTSFEILKKDGTKHEFVQMAASIWALNKVWNPTRSAYVQYEYLDMGSGTYKKTPSGLSSISIKTAADTVVAQTDFIYETRPDTSSVYMAGELRNLDKRINKITVKAGSETVRSYHMSYGRSKLTGASTLKYIQECGLQSQCYEPITFNWTQKDFLAAHSTTNELGISSTHPDTEEAMSGDFNNDGITDIVISNGNNWFKIRLGLGNGVWENEAGPGSVFMPILFDSATQRRITKVVDFNADGYSDIVNIETIRIATVGEEGVFEVRLTPYISDGLPKPTLVMQPTQVFRNVTASNILDQEYQSLDLIDVNGDALPDIVFINKFSTFVGSVTAYLQKGSDGTSTEFEYIEGSSRGYAIQKPTYFDSLSKIFGGYSVGTYNIATGDLVTPGEVRFADFNNDGYIDLLFKGTEISLPYTYPTNPPSNVDSSEGWYVAFSKLGRGSNIDFEVILNMKEFKKLPMNASDKFIMADFNNDGFIDIHTDTNLILNSGAKEFISNAPMLKVSDFLGNGIYGKSINSFIPIDGNGDGFTDFAILEEGQTSLDKLGFNQNGKIVYYDFAGSTDSEKITSLQNMDVNSDGVQDIVIVHKSGKVTSHIIGGDNQEPADLIESIVSSNGLKTQIEYGFGATDTEGLYTPDADAQQPQGTWALDAPVFDVTGSINLVKRVTDDAPSTVNASDTVSKRYAYVGGKLQAGGRGFLGFRKLIEIDETFNVKTVTEYAQEFPYQGMPLSTYTVTQADDFDAAGINSFVSNDVLQAASGSTTVSGFEALSNLNSSGGTTLDKLSSCKDTINSGTDASLTWLSCSRNILNVKEFATKGTNAKFNPVFPYIETAIEESFHTKTEFDSGAKLIDRGGILKTIITTSEYAGSIDNFYGDLTKQIVETSVVSSDGASKIAHTVVTDLEYEQNNVANWWLGRMTNQTVTSSRSAGSYSALSNIARTISTSGSSGFTVLESDGRISYKSGPSNYTVGDSLGSLVDYDVSHLTNDLSDPYNTEVTRNTIFSYNDNGLLLSSTIEPNLPEMSLTTTYGYDTWGNKTTVVKTSHAGAPADLQFWRKAETVYDANGVYPTHVYEFPNGEGSKRLTSQVNSRNALGQAGEVQGQNGLKSFKTFDGFGRTLTTSNSLGAYTLISYEGCQTDIHAPANCNLVITQTSNVSPSQKTFSDKLGQTMRVSKVDQFGNWLHIDSQYDKIGRAIAVSNPHTGSAEYWTSSSYDMFGRVLKTVRPNNQASSVEYDGLYTTTKDANGLNKASLVNALGQVVYVKEFKTSGSTESIYKEVNFQYDTQGNSTKTLGDGSTITTAYNLIGQSISTTDPAKGTWYIRSNALGEAVAQLNAKGDYTSIGYDDLGRTTSRAVNVLTSGDLSAPVLGTQLETATWDFDTAANGMGKLGSVSGSFKYVGMNTTYSDTYTYNGFSQPQTQTSVIDGSSYKQSWSYDSVGRVQVHYDASNGMSASPTRGTKTHYNSHNYVSGLSNVAADHFYFTPLDSDNWGNISRYQFGSGVISHASYNEVTGRLDKLYAGKNSGNDEITDLAYFYDAVGNLDYKTDSQLGYKEDFSYDDTYRIESVAAQGIFTGLESSVDDYNLSITYHAGSSNIKTKSNYENGAQYNYGGSGACNGNTCSGSVLTSVGNLTFEYDANGNRILEKRSGVIERQSEFTSYEKPWSITKGNNSAKFAYGAGQQRIKQVAITDGQSQTLYYVGGVEWQYKDSAWFFKRRIAGYAIEEQVKNDVGAIELKLSYTHKDYQGSVVAITDENGAIQQRLSYDIYGARRDVLYNHATGYIKPTSSLYDLIGAHTYSAELNELVRQVSLDSRGYTGHEHLDGVELIHMNGRVYDAMSGLFLSADPNIPDASDEYSLNRYSYVSNNPINFVDPSGYWGISLSSLDPTKGSFWRAYVGVGQLAFIPGVADEHERFRKTEAGQLTYSIAFTVATGGAGTYWAIAGGFAQGYMATGTLEGAAIGALFAGASVGVGTIAGKIGNVYVQAAARAAMHGVLGGIRADMNGGSFRSGFTSAGVTSLVGDAGAYGSIGLSPAGSIAAAAVLGGTTSVISGGKFANGAITGAFVQAFNHNNHPEELVMEGAAPEAPIALDGDCGNGASCAFANSAVYEELIKLDNKLIEDQKGRVFITGGHRISLDGKNSISLSTGEKVRGVGYHNIQRGAKAVDIRFSSTGLSRSEVVSYVKNNTSFKVLVSNSYPQGVSSQGHIHLTCNSRACDSVGRD